MTAPMTREELATDDAMLRARALVERHIAVFGYVPNPDKIKEAIATELRAGIAQTSGWQPIETASSIGEILLWWKYSGVGVGGWDDEGNGWRCEGDECVPKNQSDCTHWMSKPDGPSNQGASK